jgi:glycosyltransferase involved in cell wall biosynthesis
VVLRARARNAHLTLALEASDAAYTPTQWQRSLHPTPLQPMIDVIFDGIDATAIYPDPAARFVLPSGRVLSTEDEVVTYVARNLEPYRGFPTFMRSLPALLARRPQAQVLVAGGDGVSYGMPPAGYPNWRERLLAELPGLDLSRVHFLGQLPYRAYLSLLQISCVHVYLTVPFVLSWSCLEAMAAGCLLVASGTPPVEEVIAHGHTGTLVDFFDPAALADQVAALLAGRGDPTQAHMRAAARQTVLDRYALPDCLARQMRLVRSLAEPGH